MADKNGKQVISGLSGHIDEIESGSKRLIALFRMYEVAFAHDVDQQLVNMILKHINEEEENLLFFLKNVGNVM